MHLLDAIFQFLVLFLLFQNAFFYYCGVDRLLFPLAAKRTESLGMKLVLARRAIAVFVLHRKYCGGFLFTHPLSLILVICGSSTWLLGIIDEFVVGVVYDMIFMFLDYVHGRKYVKCIIHPPLHILEINLG